MYWKLIERNNEMYTFSYFTQDDVCRLCWSKNASREIYAEFSNIIVENSIADLIKGFLEIDIYNTHLSKVCEKCCEELKRIDDFKNFCRNSDVRLREILQNMPKTEIKIDKNASDAEIDNPEDLYESIFEETDLQIETKIEKNKSKVRKKYKAKDVPPTYCKICCLNLESVDKFSLHNSEVHGIENEGTVFKCFGCEKRFKNRKARLNHEINFCSGLKDGYKCYKCDRFLPRRSVYEAHIRDHTHNVIIDLPEYIFKCLKCKQSYKTNDMLKSHMMEHEKEKNYICDVCGRVFTRRDYLHKHKLTHNNVRLHQCPHCEFRATQKSSLTVHIRKHTGERPYRCDICPQRCVSSSNLRAHHRRHLGEKKYECNICHKKFGYKLSLEEHILGIHMHTESHPCTLCEATYTRKRGLRRHLAAKHGTNNKESIAIDNIDYPKNEGVIIVKQQEDNVFMV